MVENKNANLYGAAFSLKHSWWPGRNRTTDTRIFNPLLEWMFFCINSWWRRQLFVKGIVEGILQVNIRRNRLSMRVFSHDSNPPLPAPGTARPYFARILNAATVLTLAPIGIALRSTKKSELWFEYGNGIPLARASANNFGGAIPTRMKT